MSERNHIFSGEVFPYRMYWKMKKKMNMTFEMMTYSDNDDWKQARSSHSNYILRSLRSEPEQDVTTILMWWYIIDISFEIWTQFQTYHTIWQDSALKGSPTTGTGYVLRMVWADVLWVRCQEKHNLSVSSHHPHLNSNAKVKSTSFPGKVGVSDDVISQDFLIWALWCHGVSVKMISLPCWYKYICK